METIQRDVKGKYAVVDKKGAEIALSLDAAYELACDRLKALIDKGVEKEDQMVVIAKVLAIVEPQ